MEAAAVTAAPASEAHVARPDAGEEASFEALCAPQFAGIYDFVLRIVRDRVVAARVVRETFAKARPAFGERDDGVAPWLFATARGAALASARIRRHRNGDEREAIDFTQVDGDRASEASVVFDRELAEVVWSAAVALRREDYALLALDVRHDVAGNADLVRVQAAFDEAVTNELLARRARHSCTALDILVADGADVAQHVRRCPRCSESRRRFVSPTQVLRAFAPLPPPRSLEREIFGATARRRRLFGIL
jgi:DNA-directed RNA polymerase specialized sigma24 family protein